MVTRSISIIPISTIFIYDIRYQQDMAFLKIKFAFCTYHFVPLDLPMLEQALSPSLENHRNYDLLSWRKHVEKQHALLVVGS